MAFRICLAFVSFSTDDRYIMSYHWCLKWQSLAWSDHTQSHLLLKSTGRVLVAHTCGDRRAART